jgi:hypothetical protein
MKVYVASSFCRKPDVREMIRLLQEQGHEVTYDWTDDDVSGLVDDPPKLRKALGQAAQRDLLGIYRAEAVVCLHDPRGRMMHFELGAAAVLCLPVIIVGALPLDLSTPCHYYLRGFQHVATPAEAAAIVSEYQKLMSGPL